MNYITYILFRIFVFKISLLPFRALYIFSDFLAFLLNKVLKYRKKVVYNNLRKCFPEKSEEEIKSIADTFYRHLTDIILETFKGFGMSEKALCKRYVFTNREILEKFYAQKRNVICACGHYNNWEWGGHTLGIYYPSKPFGVYKTIKNTYIDSYIKRKRTQRNITLISMEETLKYMKATHDRPSLYVLLADQSPSNHKKAIWVDFFNTKTACLPGVEVAAKLFDMPVVYFKSSKIKRGYYEVSTTVITEYPKETQKGEITQQYMKILEQDIKDLPPYWIWSHRRWKRTYESVFPDNVNNL
ncbi:MAG: Lipid A biosynthesis lauroyl acyltransferase [Bacteroidetes bacterium ADurb.Bin408]|nr:MAG: Lipid A biosynthesis lauroyl acyltransferase [Bacteroidetes bacterium ADurb.Bin408]